MYIFNTHYNNTKRICYLCGWPNVIPGEKITLLRPRPFCRLADTASDPPTLTFLLISCNDLNWLFCLVLVQPDLTASLFNAKKSLTSLYLSSRALLSLARFIQCCKAFLIYLDIMNKFFTFNLNNIYIIPCGTPPSVFS